jgi:hypothetical protein
MITNDKRCTQESKSGLPWQKQLLKRVKLFAPQN